MFTRSATLTGNMFRFAVFVTPLLHGIHFQVAGKFDVVDDFIKEFCRHDICFQYCLCLLTCAMWAKDKLKNREMLIGKTKKKGIEEIGEKDTMSCLSGLL